MQKIKGPSSRRVQMEFPEVRKRYWGRRFWARGYFSTTSDNVTDDIIIQYLELHSKRHATGISRQDVHYVLVKMQVNRRLSL